MNKDEQRTNSPINQAKSRRKTNLNLSTCEKMTSQPIEDPSCSKIRSRRREDIVDIRIYQGRTWWFHRIREQVLARMRLGRLQSPKRVHINLSHALEKRVMGEIGDPRTYGPQPIVTIVSGSGLTFFPKITKNVLFIQSQTNMNTFLYLDLGLARKKNELFSLFEVLKLNFHSNIFYC